MLLPMQDEELTFDYNFERYGDKPMRCYCSTKLCRCDASAHSSCQSIGSLNIPISSNLFASQA